MNLRNRIQRIQDAVGVVPDGIVGPRTVAALELAVLPAKIGDSEVPRDGVDKRTAKNIATLVSRAREPFERFARLAKATAATMGCDYIAICGTRSWHAQDELYAQGRTKPGARVTNARAGYSWHNFGVALDFGVFRDGAYLDSDAPELARRVHIACAKHAEVCGLEWGGDWKSFQDIPHYQLKVSESLATARVLYQEGKWS
ncbi:M15 family metallopeptidase [Rubritalea spongiae]|uniref:M15 family metallopeptidase n=1 Tax=Rubritalea spongiae TaxID=430797 RepID=A0ABW5E0N5_9BACT